MYVLACTDLAFLTGISKSLELLLMNSLFYSFVQLSEIFLIGRMSPTEQNLVYLFCACNLIEVPLEVHIRYYHYDTQYHHYYLCFSSDYSCSQQWMINNKLMPTGKQLQAMVLVCWHSSCLVNSCLGYSLDGD